MYYLLISTTRHNWRFTKILTHLYTKTQNKLAKTKNLIKVSLISLFHHKNVFVFPHCKCLLFLKHDLEIKNVFEKQNQKYTR